MKNFTQYIHLLRYNKCRIWPVPQVGTFLQANKWWDGCFIYSRFAHKKKKKKKQPRIVIRKRQVR